jgi:hypothetical protein
MQGAAQRPKAAPRSAPSRCAPPPASDEAVEGERQQSHHREAEDDDDEPCDGEEKLPVLAEEAPGGGDRGAERHEDRCEAGDERQAGQKHAPPSLADRLPGDDGQIARDEREHAGRGERDEPGSERQRDLRLHHHPVEAGGSLPGRLAARASGSSGGLADRARGGGLRSLQRRSATATAATRSRRRPAAAPGDQVEALLRGSTASTASPNRATRRPSISSSESPAASARG